MVPLGMLAEWALRSTMLIAAGALLLRAAAVDRPALRLTAWSAMLLGSLLLPLLTATLPALSLGIRSGSPVTAVAAEPAPPAAGPPRPMQSAPIEPEGPESSSLSWNHAASTAYAMVAGALLMRLFCGLALSRRVRRRSVPTTVAPDVRESVEVQSPVTVGVFRPAILLPPDWRDWDETTLKAVLAHERSHARRRDPALQVVSAIHRALLWASPAAWWLHRNIVRAAEDVSDGDAIAASGDRAGYAGILLGFMQRVGPKTERVGVSMARYERPEVRIRRILHSTAITRATTRRGTAAVAVAGASLACLAASVQLAARPQEHPAARFEVASVKPASTTGERVMGVRVSPGGRVVISSFTLKALVGTAFGVSFWQIAGGEPWMQNESYVVEAKPAEAMARRITTLRYTLFEIEDPLLREMLQSLLIERFQLRVRRETRSGDVYLLEQGDRPFRGKPIQTGADEKTFGSIGYAGGQWNIAGASMPQLARFASGFVLRAPVFDRTGIAGHFDYRQRVPDLTPEYSGDQSSSFRGYLKELGLRLTRAEGPVETMVIEHAARPTPN